MVVKGLQHLGYNSFGNKTIHLPLFPFEILQVFTSARQKTEKLHTGIDVFFRSFWKYRFEKNGSGDRFFGNTIPN